MTGLAHDWPRPMPEHWRTEAACHGTDPTVFFDERHGTRALAILGEATSAADLGADFGAGLTAREVDYLVREEWARTADDVLWRRTKCGLQMSEAQRARLADFMEATA